LLADDILAGDWRNVPAFGESSPRNKLLAFRPLTRLGTRPVIC
jgi:hypothetical protein